MQAFKQLTELVSCRTRPATSLTSKCPRNREKQGHRRRRWAAGRARRQIRRPALRRFLYGGQQENVQDQAGPGRLPVRRRLQVHRRRRDVDARQQPQSAADVLQPGPRRSHRRQDVYVLGISLYPLQRTAARRSSGDAGKGVHPDQHALWIDPRDGRHMIVGTDGGFYVTYDRADNWDHLNHMAHRPVLPRRRRQPAAVPRLRRPAGQRQLGRAEPDAARHRPDQRGLDRASAAATASSAASIPNDPDLVYCESQDGNMIRRNLRTGEPGAGSCGPQGSRARARRPTASTGTRRSSCRTTTRASSTARGNYVFRSLKHGDDLRVISPEITPHQARQRHRPGRVAAQPRRALGRHRRRRPVGDARRRQELDQRRPTKVGLPGPRWVATIEPSRFAEGRAYVVFDAHRSDDDEPYVYVTEDFGQTWKSLRAQPAAPARRACLREDVSNPNLLYLGTEFAVWASLNRGQTWTKINNNLPTVAVHEIARASDGRRRSWPRRTAAACGFWT